MIRQQRRAVLRAISKRGKGEIRIFLSELGREVTLSPDVPQKDAVEATMWVLGGQVGPMPQCLRDAVERPVEEKV